MGACAPLHATHIDAVMISSKTIPREKCPQQHHSSPASQQSQQTTITTRPQLIAKDAIAKGLSESVRVCCVAWALLLSRGKHAATRELQGLGRSLHADRGAAETSDASAVDASCTADAGEQDGSAEDVHTLIYVLPVDDRARHTEIWNCRALLITHSMAQR